MSTENAVPVRCLLEITSLSIGADAVCMCEPKQKCPVDKKHTFLEHLCETIFTQKWPRKWLLRVWSAVVNRSDFGFQRKVHCSQFLCFPFICVGREEESYQADNVEIGQVHSA